MPLLRLAVNDAVLVGKNNNIAVVVYPANQCSDRHLRPSPGMRTRRPWCYAR
ncbi:MAG: hypothetical protein FJ100_04955 [Deltaproteobacteria bacterium]|nr:hypothetical protein [Deltaproteobacteria bacterium]